MLYPQNGEGIVAIDSVTSRHPMHIDTHRPRHAIRSNSLHLALLAMLRCRLIIRSFVSKLFALCPTVHCQRRKIGVRLGLEG